MVGVGTILADDPLLTCRIDVYKRQDEVPLVFTVGVIRYQNDFSLLQVLQSFGNGIEVHRKLSLKAAAQQHFFCERVLLRCF